MSTVAISAVATSTWNIDPVHSTVQFKVKHMMVSNVKGEFTNLTGKLDLSDADVSQSCVEATIDAASIDTRDPQRDAHVKSADFLDVETFPSITFRSRHISKETSERLAVEGDLTIHGTTHRVVLDVEELSAPTKDPWGAMRIGMSATTRISRRDFGLTWNTALEAGGVLVGDEIYITLDVEFVKV
jgi:polyisoprenoid-binding protein YceI